MVFFLNLLAHNSGEEADVTQGVRVIIKDIKVKSFLQLQYVHNGTPQ